MSFSEIESSLKGWHHKNRQPGKIPKDLYGLPEPHLTECPHYSLIEICAALIEIDPDELRDKKEFCGQKGEPENSLGNFGPLSGFRGVRLKPQATCAEVHDKLEAMVEFMKQKVSPQTEEVNERLASLENPRSKKEVLDKYVKDLDILREQRRIFSYWQAVIFATCCVPAENYPEDKLLELPEANLTPKQKNKLVIYHEVERQDPHFRRLSSSDDLSYEEVMMRVESFLASLNEQVAGQSFREQNTGNVFEDFYNGRYSQGARHCPQAPKRDEFGIYS